MKRMLKKIITAIITAEARLVLKKYKPGIVAITGSVGKTSTKDAIYTVLNHSLYVRRSEKSFNSEIGIPLTILDCENGWSNPYIWLKNILSGFSLIVFRNHYPKWLVLEVGADNPGDIEKVTQWLKPDVSVVTRIGEVPVHVEFFPSVEHVVREKSFLVTALKKEGVLILGHDDPAVLKMKELSKSKTITYGFTEGAEMLATNIAITYEQDLPAGLSFKLEHKGKTLPVHLDKLLGKHHVYAALAALSVAESLGLNLVDALRHINDYESPPGRLRLLDGINGSMIIDDTYNSSPVALHAALDTLHEIKTRGRKFALLGDMLELGTYTKEEHVKAGKRAGTVCDYVLLVGPRAQYFAEGAEAAGMDRKKILFFDDATRAGKHIEMKLLEGDVVLIKGSQSIRMEKAVEEIMARPDLAKKLLVRQEAEWKQR